MTSDRQTHAEPPWLAGFREWTAQPCPDGEWVYRGQSERFASVVPSLLRDPTKRFRQAELFDFDRTVAARLFSTSPVFGEGHLHEHLVTGDYGDDDARTPDAKLSFRELVRALAQHYGYPTLFVDLSLHPLVAALFATHEFSDAGAHVSDEPSIVYRWPANRLSASRLRIAGSQTDGSDAIGVIDISHINPHLKRPRNQFALLATPVQDPKPFFQPFQSSLDALVLTDLREVGCCEEFRLPARAGDALATLPGVSVTALFPDAVDPGFSYLAFIALLSLVIHEPDASTGEQARKLREGFEEGIAAARVVLDMECARLVGEHGVVVSRALPSLTDSRAMLSFRIDLARAAARLMAGPTLRARPDTGIRHGAVAEFAAAWRLRRQSAKLGRERAEAMREEARRRARAMEAAVRSALPEHAPVAFDPPAYVTTSAGTDWLLPEIDRRSRIIDAVIARSELVPSYALQDAALYERLSRVLPSDDAYEEAARTQLAAQDGWLARVGGAHGSLDAVGAPAHLSV